MGGKRIEKRFGTIAVEKGFITKEQLLEAMQKQIEQDLDGLEHRLIGSILYSLGYMTVAQIDEVLKWQKKKSKGTMESRFGDTAVEKGFVTRDEVLEALRMQRQQDSEGLEHRLIGSLLYSLGHMTIPQINDVLESMKKDTN